MRVLRSGIIILIALLSLQSCMNVASSGAQAIYNRRSLEKSVSDQYLTMQIYRALHPKPEFQDANIVISTFNGEVLLTGQVPQADEKTAAEKIVRQIKGVGEIHNLISVGSPSSTLTKVSDSWITSKVKAQLIASEDLDATQIKVVTENGTVYLMGTLLPAEADAAVEIARNVDGVQSVIKIFSYITISKQRAHENEVV